MGKSLNTRIQLKNDIEANWNLLENFIPMPGEIIIYNPDENYENPRIKIGNGESFLNSLSFINDAITNEAIDEICGTTLLS